MKEGDIILAIPKGKINGRKVYQCKNIEDMSGQDFMDWLLSIYSFGVLEENLEIFENKFARIKIFEGVLTWWSLWYRTGPSKMENLEREM